MVKCRNMPRSRISTFLSKRYGVVLLVVFVLGGGVTLNFSFPSQVYAAPSVILSGGFTETEAADGGVQRKVAYVNGNWYAFYEDGTDSFYKKSSDGSTWGSAVDLDSTDADNIAPSIWVEGTLIYAAWRDTGAFKLEVRTINTASSDALGTLCSSGANSATNRPVSIAVADDGTVYVLDSDSLFGRLLKLTYSGCSFTDITSGSGLESGDSTNNQKNYYQT